MEEKTMENGRLLSCTPELLPKVGGGAVCTWWREAGVEATASAERADFSGANVKAPES